MKQLLFLLFFSASLAIQAQIDYKELRKQVSDPENDLYHSHVWKRFRDSDSTLTMEHFRAFYYGSVFLKSYNAEEISKVETEIREANFAQEFLRAYELADSLLNVYPVSIQAYFEKAFACYNLKRFEEERYNTMRYKVLVRVIRNSGDGKSISAPWYANLPNDEFEVLKSMEAEIREETELDINEEVYDHFFLKPNKAKMKEVFFNVTIQNRSLE